MKVYIVQKSIVGSIDRFGFDISDTLEFNGEILGVFGSENDAYKLVDELVKKDCMEIIKIYKDNKLYKIF